MERENISLRSENAAMKAVLQQERQRITIHEKKLIIYEHSIDELNKKMRNRENEIRDLRTQVEQKQQMLTQKEIEKDKQKRRYNSKFAVEQDKLTREMEAKMEQHKLAMRVCFNNLILCFQDCVIYFLFFRMNCVTRKIN